MTPAILRRRVLAVLAAAAVAAACGPSGPSQGQGPGPGVPPSFDPAGLVLRVTSGGGLPPPSELRWVPSPPELSVYGDGRVIRHRWPDGPREPLAPIIVESHVPAATISTLLIEARTRDLLRSGSLDCPGLFDAGTTVLATWADGAAHRFAVYGSGVGDLCEGLSDPDRDAHATFAAFIERLGVLPEETPPAAYVPERLAIYVGPVDPAAFEPDLVPARVAWPLGSLATFGIPIVAPRAEPTSPFLRCGVLTGDELATIWPIVVANDRLTLFVSDGTAYRVGPRPLLPDEGDACLPIG